MKKISFFILCLIAVNTYCQLSLGWVYHPENNAVGGGSCVVISTDTDSNGFVYTLGEHQGTADLDPSSDTMNLAALPGYDVFLAKYDSLGNYIWAFRFGANYFNNASKLLIDHNGDIIVSGIFEGNMDFDPSPALYELNSGLGQDAFIAKYDNDGDFIWALNYGNTEDLSQSSICINSANEIISVGHFPGTILDADPSGADYFLNSIGDQEAYCINFSENGTLNWAMNFGGTTAPHDCYATSVYADALDNIYICGRFSGTSDFDPGPGIFSATSYLQDAFFVKFGPTGLFIWAKTLGGTSSDMATSIVTDASGDIYVTGHFAGTVDMDPSVAVLNKTSFSPSVDIFISKFTPTGNLIWNEAYGGDYIDLAKTIMVDNNENLYLAGRFEDNVNLDPADGRVFLACYSSVTGSFTWAKQAIEPTTSYDVRFRDQYVYNCGDFKDSVFFNPPSSGLLTAGYGIQSGFFSRYESSGDYEWAKKLGGYTDDSTASEYISVMDFKSNGNIVIAGHFTHRLTLDPQQPETEVISNHERDLFMVELTPDNDVVWTKRIGGNNEDKVTGLFVDDDNIYLCGTFEDSIDFDSTGAAPTIYSEGYEDAFIAKFDSQGDFIWSKIISGPGQQTILMTKSEDDFIYTSGTFSDVTDFDPSPSNFIITGSYFPDMYYGKYSLDADLIWVKKVDPSLTFTIASLTITGDTMITMTGWLQGTADFDPGPGVSSFSSILNGADVFVTRYDTSSQFISAFVFGGNDIDKANSLVYDNVGNCYITGGFYGTCNFNPLGPPVNVLSQGVDDIFFAKYNPLNQLEFVKVIGSAAGDDGKILIKDSDENIWLIGAFSSTIDSDPGPGINYLISKGGEDILIQKFDTLGNHIWGKSLGGPATGYPHTFAITDSDECYLAGTYTYETDVDPSTDIHMLNTFNGIDCYLINLNPCVVSYHVIDTSNCGGILYDNEWLPSTGSYQLTYTNSLGCDSILTVNLTSFNSYSSLDTANCSSYSSPSGNFIFTVDGIYQDTLVNWLGCDSIITINLDILSSLVTLNVVTCDSFISPGGSEIWYTDGIYYDTLQNSFGCDSIFVIDLNILNVDTSVSVAACNYYLSPSGSFIWNTSGIFTDTLINQFGCDSIVAVNLTINTTNAMVTQTATYLEANEPSAIYQWLDCNNSFLTISGAINQQLLNTSNGSFAVSITDINGCVDTSLCYLVSGVGYDEQTNSTEHIFVYPNPTSNKVTIFYSGTQDELMLELYDPVGQKIANWYLIQGNNLIDISGLANGTYFYTYNGQIGKLIKQH